MFVITVQAERPSIIILLSIRFQGVRLSCSQTINDVCDDPHAKENSEFGSMIDKNTWTLVNRKSRKNFVRPQ